MADMAIRFWTDWWTGKSFSAFLTLPGVERVRSDEKQVKSGRVGLKSKPQNDSSLAYPGLVIFLPIAPKQVPWTHCRFSLYS